MRRSLVWTLGATAVLSGVAMSMGDKPARIVAAIDRAPATPELAGAAARVDPQASASPLPQALEPVLLEPAQRDLFAAVQPPAPPPPPAQASPALFVGPPPPPAPPAINWRYLGSMTTPAGERLVMLARGDTTTTIQPGARLDDGYVVESIRPDAVRLVYPLLGTAVDLAVPPVPPSAIR